MLITEAGRVKLIDMGLARMQKLNDPAGDLTASGVTLGTFDYISPEQARDPRTADVRQRTSVSLGCTLFSCSRAARLFPKERCSEEAAPASRGRAPDVRVFGPSCPRRFPKSFGG